MTSLLKILGFCLFSVVHCFSSSVSPYYEVTPLARESYDLLLSLRLDEASKVLAKMSREEPNNALRHLLENYHDCLTLFISEDEELFSERKSNKRRRLRQVEQANLDSPYFLFSMAQIHFQWAITRLKFQEYFKAATEIREAYLLLQENVKRYPEFPFSYQYLGVMHALIGTIPDQYKWGVKLVGLDGTLLQGLQELERIVADDDLQGHIFYEEALILYAYVLLHLDNRGEDAWDLLHDHGFAQQENPLFLFILSNFAHYLGKNDLAIDYLSARPQSDDFYDFHYCDLMLGIAKLHRLDEDADQPLLQFIERTRGKHYIKEAHQKLAWHYMIHGQTDQSQKHLELCKAKGESVVDEDQAALTEARSNRASNIGILKGRLLFDGGYYDRSLEELESIEFVTLSTSYLQLEYRYRMARVLHKLNNLIDAETYYNETIEHGQYESSYFACNSALQLGLIHELRGNYEESKRSFLLCLSMKPDQYRKSLHQKAKSGLSRLKHASKP